MQSRSGGPRRAFVAACIIGLSLLSSPAILLPQQAPRAASPKDSIDALWKALDGYRTFLHMGGIGLSGGIVRFRQRLVAAAAVIPGDPWVEGMLAKYGQPDATGGCRGDSWICTALRSSDQARRGTFEPADSTLLLALRRMPEDLRCAWKDVSPLVEKDKRDAVAALPCDKLDSLAPLFWNPADPLYVSAGNERRVDHGVRWSHITLETSARAAVCFHAGTSRLQIEGSDTSGMLRDLDIFRDQVIRLGVPLTWSPPLVERAMSTFMDAAAPAVVDDPSRGEIDAAARMRARQATIAASPMGLAGTFGVPTSELCPNIGAWVPTYGAPPPPRFHFIPAWHAIESPLAAVPEDWDLYNPSAREMYHPPFPDRFTPLEHQIAYFRRGDSALLVAAADIRGNETLTGKAAVNSLDPLIAMLAVAADPTKIPDLWRTTADPVFRWGVTVAAAPALVGLEVLTPNGVGRSRYAAGPRPTPAQRLAVSDLLLLERPRDPLPSSIEVAIPFVAGHTRVASNGTAGLIWEVYGLQAGDSVSYALGATRIDSPSAVSGLLRAIGLANAQSDATHIVWRKAITQTTERLVDGITLSVAGLSEGRYALELTVTVAGQAPVTATQTLQIVKP